MNRGDLKLKVEGILSWRINYCLLFQSNLTSSYRWNSKSWFVNWALGLIMEMGPRKIFFLRFLYIQYGPHAVMYAEENCFYPNLIWPDLMFIQV